MRQRKGQAQNVSILSVVIDAWYEFSVFNRVLLCLLYVLAIASPSAFIVLANTCGIDTERNLFTYNSSLAMANKNDR